MGSRRWWCWYCKEDREDGIYHSGGGNVEICDHCSTYFCEDEHSYRCEICDETMCYICGEEHIRECGYCGKELCENNLEKHQETCEKKPK